MEQYHWIFCPICDNKTRMKIREDTEIKNFPLYCPKCRQESLINVKSLKVVVMKEPDAQTQSRLICEIKSQFVGFVLFHKVLRRTPTI